MCWRRMFCFSDHNTWETNLKYIPFKVVLSWKQCSCDVNTGKAYWIKLVSNLRLLVNIGRVKIPLESSTCTVDFGSVKAHSTPEKISRTENFPKILLLKSWTFSTSFFFRRKICVGRSHFTRFFSAENFPEWKK
jgi:hypothetical protein